MRVLVVAGARPNFMKVAPILRALAAEGHAGILVHTGQHYDTQMSDAFFRDLKLPEPDYHLGVGSGSHAVQTARIMEAFEPVLLKEHADWLVVVGDVNSTLACSLVASKLKEQTGTRIAHVEAGLRSHDWRMPEEINRVLTDRVSDLLLTPSLDAQSSLEAEGIPKERVVFVGNVMIDTLFQQLPTALNLDMPSALGLKHKAYVLSTLHRPSNVDNLETLSTLLAALADLSRRIPVVIPLHPRTLRSAEAFGLHDELTHLKVLAPLSYCAMLSLTHGAAAVLTDSGGLQEETTALGIPCITLREQTERPITVTHGTNRLVSWPPTIEGVLADVDAAIQARQARSVSTALIGWDGNAASRSVRALDEYANFNPPARPVRNVAGRQ